MTTSLLLFSSRYKNFFIVGENWRRINVKCQNFCQIYDFKNLTNLTKYYKNPEIPTYINLILQINRNVSKILSQLKLDFQTFIKWQQQFWKLTSKIKTLNCLSKVHLLFCEKFLSQLKKDLLPNDKSLKHFQDSCLQVLNSFAPLKTKYACKIKRLSWREG